MSSSSGGKLLRAIVRRLLGEETWPLCACIFPYPRRFPIRCEIFDPFRIVRLEEGGYISEYELAFPEMAWDVGYLTKTRRSPFSLWDLASKALLTPIRKEAEWKFKCFIEWKYRST